MIYREEISQQHEARERAYNMTGNVLKLEVICKCNYCEA